MIKIYFHITLPMIYYFLSLFIDIFAIAFRCFDIFFRFRYSFLFLFFFFSPSLLPSSLFLLLLSFSYFLFYDDSDVVDDDRLRRHYCRPFTVAADELDTTTSLLRLSDAIAAVYFAYAYKYA